METKKHKHSSDEKDISDQSDNEIVYNSNADKSSYVRDIDPDLRLNAIFTRVSFAIVQ